VRLGTIYLQADLGEMYRRFAFTGRRPGGHVPVPRALQLPLTTTLQERIPRVPSWNFMRVATAARSLLRIIPCAVKHAGPTKSHNDRGVQPGCWIRTEESSNALMASEERLRLAPEAPWNRNLGLEHLDRPRHLG